MPCSATAALSSRQSSWVGMCTPASAKSSATRAVRGSHVSSMYLSKYSPVAYFERSKPANAEPRSFAISIDARTQW
ncbi:Uncharacterised protein [Mycobacteroides abscessus subsp. abscessus]|nr:Uncharacterised protein [Mycobacteroides abscessus subsp. abscessus]